LYIKLIRESRQVDWADDTPKHLASLVRLILTGDASEDELRAAIRSQIEDILSGKEDPFLNSVATTINPLLAN
jgi:hypothetical protein